jgi:hypothetical protein
MSLTEIRLLASDVAEGETLRTICPACEGGTKNEKSLTLTRDDTGVVYNCYRLTCATAGRIGGRANLIRIRNKEVAPRSTRYEGELHELTPDAAQLLYENVGFDADHVLKSRARLGNKGRIAFPILSPLLRRRGWVLRRYTGYGPKAMTYMDADEPHTSWYTTNEWARGEVAYLIEDIPSAVRAARYVDSIALLGTGVSLRALTEIAQHYRRVVWALDADATATAVNQARKYGIYFESSRVKILQRDFKNEEESCLSDILSER